MSCLQLFIFKLKPHITMFILQFNIKLKEVKGKGIYIQQCKFKVIINIYIILTNVKCMHFVIYMKCKHTTLCK